MCYIIVDSYCTCIAVAVVLRILFIQVGCHLLFGPSSASERGICSYDENLIIINIIFLDALYYIYKIL